MSPLNLSAPNSKKSDQKSQKSLIGWAILLIFSLGILFAKAFPQYMELGQKKSEIQNFVSEIKLLENQKEQKTQQLSQKEIEFNEKAESFIGLENQIYPEKLKYQKLARILELFALSLDNFDTRSRDSKFVIEKINFSKSSRLKGKPYFQTEVNMKLISDSENIRTFITYLQNQSLPEIFENSKQIDPSVYLFVKNNLLPLAHIQSIRMEPVNAKDKNDDTFDVSLNLTFFSRG